MICPLIVFLTLRRCDNGFDSWGSEDHVRHPFSRTNGDVLLKAYDSVEEVELFWQISSTGSGQSDPRLPKMREGSTQCFQGIDFSSNPFWGGDRNVRNVTLRLSYKVGTYSSRRPCSIVDSQS